MCRAEKALIKYIIGSFTRPSCHRTCLQLAAGDRWQARPSSPMSPAALEVLGAVKRADKDGDSGPETSFGDARAARKHYHQQRSSISSQAGRHAGTRLTRTRATVRILSRIHNRSLWRSLCPDMRLPTRALRMPAAHNGLSCVWRRVRFFLRSGWALYL